MSYYRSPTYPISAWAVKKGDRYTMGTRGFTMVELIVVMAILGVLALMAIPGYGKIKDIAREARAMAEIRGLEKSINAFAIEKGTLPTLNEFDTVIMQGSLVDPWGHPYAYFPVVIPDTGRMGTLDRLNDDFDLYSKGRDGDTNLLEIDDPKSLNDILRAGDGGYVGLAKNYTF